MTPDPVATPPVQGSRAGRIARALTLGYTYQAIVALTGLVLTPFLLRELGVTDFGRWLVVGQVLGLLGLLDLGVTGILPREVARASGSGVGEVVRRAWWLVWLQTPLVALAAAGVWYGVSESRPELAGPLAVILAAFVAQFPLRVPGAVLSGLQDLTFGAAAQAAGWAVTTTVSVGLVFAGWGLYALAAGWSAGQLLGCALCWWRLRRKFPQARPLTGWPGRGSLTGYLRPSFWTSARQAAYLMAHGTDLIVLGWVLGPVAVVTYSCTAKLVSFVANQPSLLLAQATPGLVELRAAGDLPRAWAACRAVSLVALLMSGGIGVVLLAANEAFVVRWVSPDVYGGPLLTVLIVLAMWTRHWVYTLVVIQYAFGHDRLLALSAAGDGVVTFAAVFGLVSAFGLVGVPLGLVAGTVGVSGLVGLVVVAREAGVCPTRVLLWYGPWVARVALVGGGVAATLFLLPVVRLEVAAAVLAAGGAGYALAARGLLRREPLHTYWGRMVAAIRGRLGWRTPG